MEPLYALHMLIIKLAKEIMEKNPSMSDEEINERIRVFLQGE